jgi:hypothetical protein
MTAVTVPEKDPKPERILLAGSNHPVHFRFIQNSSWKLFVGLLAAAVVAGLYYGLLQVDWYVHIGGLHFQIFNLKKGWDAGHFSTWLIPPRDWPVYRHVAFRNLLEPEIAIIAVLTLIAKPKYWGKRASTLHLIASPFILLVSAIVLNMVGVFLLFSVWPGAFWNHGELAKLSAAQLLLGLIVGRVLHPLWAPAGSTLQEFQLDRAVSRARKHGEDGRVPLWVKLPIAPPTLRERFSQMWRGSKAKLANVAGTHRVALTVISVVMFLLMLLGLLGHYYVGVLGHTVPYLAP